MVKKEFFNYIFISNVLKKFNVFLVDCNNLGFSSIKIFIKLVKEGYIVGIFFSGMWIEEDVFLKKGVVIIVSMVKVFIVFVVYKGFVNVKELFLKGFIVIFFGKFIYFGEDKLIKDCFVDVLNYLIVLICVLEEIVR